MNTSEVVKTVAQRLEITQKDSKKLLRETVRTFKKLLNKNIGFTIPELGTFGTHKRDRRKAFIPYYRRYMILPPKRVVDFHPSIHLKEEVKDLEVSENE